MRVQLDETNWAELKEVSELRRSDRHAVNQRIVMEADPETGGTVLRGSMDDDMAEAVIEIAVTDWSLPFPVPGKNPHVPATVKTPGNAGSINLLTLEQDDNLRKAIQPHLDAILGKTAPVKDNPDPTPGSDS